MIVSQCVVKLQLHYAIYQLQFYSNLLIHILSLSNSHSNVASLQKNREDKSHHVIVALSIKIIVIDQSGFRPAGGGMEQVFK